MFISLLSLDHSPAFIARVIGIEEEFCYLLNYLFRKFLTVLLRKGRRGYISHKRSLSPGLLNCAFLPSASLGALGTDERPSPDLVVRSFDTTVRANRRLCARADTETSLSGRRWAPSGEGRAS